jgi:O-antigen/teichoic acid export membrane protein
MLWLGSATLAARLLDVGATLAVVSLLSKEQMGLASLALSACAILESLSGLGIGSALVQANEVSRDEESSLFWITSAGGVALGLILLGISPLLTATYEEARLGPLLWASALKLVLVSMGVVPMQLLSKALKFREIGTVQTLSSLGEGVTKIVCAFSGAGAWSLVLGNIARGLMLLLAVLAFSGFRPRLHCSGQEARRFLGFGMKVVGSSVLSQLYRNSDNFLVAKLLGMEALGLYKVAFDIAMQPTDAIIIVVGRVGFPVYARLSADLPALRTTFLSNLESILLLVAPVAAVIFFAAHPLLGLIGDGRWAVAVPAVRVLVWAALLRSATTMFSSLYVALGKPQYSTLEAAITLLGLSVSFWLGLTSFPELGVLSVCYAWVLVCPLMLAGHLLLSRQLIGLPIGTYLKKLAVGVGPIPLIVVGLSVLDRVLHVAQTGAAHVALLALAALLLHWAYLRWVLQKRLRDLLPRRTAHSAGAAAARRF